VRVWTSRRAQADRGSQVPTIYCRLRIGRPSGRLTVYIFDVSGRGPIRPRFNYFPCMTLLVAASTENSPTSSLGVNTLN
jgi:hypothetical protein